MVVTRKMRKRMEIKKGLKKNSRRIKERYWKEPYYQPPVRILVLFFVSINKIFSLFVIM